MRALNPNLMLLNAVNWSKYRTRTPPKCKESVSFMRAIAHLIESENTNLFIKSKWKLLIWNKSPSISMNEPFVGKKSKSYDIKNAKVRKIVFHLFMPHSISEPEVSDASNPFIDGNNEMTSIQVCNFS